MGPHSVVHDESRVEPSQSPYRGRGVSIGRERATVAVNLDSQFAISQLTETWLTAVAELADRIEFPHGRSGSPLPQRQRTMPTEPRVSPMKYTSEGTTRRPEANSARLIRCIPGGPNRADGRSYPEEVWVRFEVLGYASEDYGGIEHFVGEVQQAYWEEDNHLFGVDFGGGIGWHIVNCLHCSTRDWHDPATSRQGRWRQPMYHAGCASPNGSVEGLQNQEANARHDTVFHESDASLSRDTSTHPPICPQENEDVNEMARSGDDLPSSDSEDPSWLGDFVDFAGNESNDENSDWNLFDDRSDNLSESSGSFDFEEYQRFTEADTDNALEGIRERYSDANWGHEATHMLGERNRFLGPHPGPT